MDESQFTEKRYEKRVDLRQLSLESRMCDITLPRIAENRIVYLVDISTNGVRFVLGDEKSLRELGVEEGDEVEIGGCILNEFVGLLSSFTAVIRWINGNMFGMRLSVPVDMSYEKLCGLAIGVLDEEDGQALLDGVQVYE